ncbi:hypothetical protein PM082_008311 [Marasmius tenuissimus]|nr:hypothetical protein PM082_008311 [Marasmius tenuissimus]
MTNTSSLEAGVSKNGDSPPSRESASTSSRSPRVFVVSPLRFRASTQDTGSQPRGSEDQIQRVYLPLRIPHPPVYNKALRLIGKEGAEGASDPVFIVPLPLVV